MSSKNMKKTTKINTNNNIEQKTIDWWQRDTSFTRLLKFIVAGIFVYAIASAAGLVTIADYFELHLQPVLRIDSDQILYSPGAAKLLPSEMAPEDVWKSIPQIEQTIIDQPDLISTGRTVDVQIGLTSEARLEWLELEPRILIRIDEYQESSIARMDAVSVCCFGGGSASQFYVQLPNSNIENGAVIASKRSNEFDFFTLEPGERAVFKLEILPRRPGEYKFTLGIEYWFKGKKQIQWMSNNFEMKVAQNFRVYDWGFSGSGAPPTYLTIRDCIYDASLGNFYTCNNNAYK